MVNLAQYTKAIIVKLAQYKKNQIKLSKTPANMRMSKGALITKWADKITPQEIKRLNPPSLGRAGRPPNPKPAKKATTSTQTKSTRGTQRKTTKKTTKKATTSTQSANQLKITRFFK